MTVSENTLDNVTLAYCHPPFWQRRLLLMRPKKKKKKLHLHCHQKRVVCSNACRGQNWTGGQPICGSKKCTRGSHSSSTPKALDDLPGQQGSHHIYTLVVRDNEETREGSGTAKCASSFCFFFSSFNSFECLSLTWKKKIRGVCVGSPSFRS